MRALNTDIKDAVDHLPSASVLALEDVSWEEYEEVLDQLQERPGLRITYNQGRLEIVTTSPIHERWKEFILRLVHVLCEEMKINFESCGGFTQKRKKDEKGTEADTCFYITNAERIIGKDEIDINVEPAPDVVVEVDKANQSRGKFPIYAAFGVPEIWRCDVKRKRIQFYTLRNNAYVEIPASQFFPILTSSVLIRFIEQSKVQGQMAALAAFRRFIQDGT